MLTTDTPDAQLFSMPSSAAMPPKLAPYPMLVETDRDKLCVQQIIDLYHRQNIDYADYFQAAAGPAVVLRR
jgi:hypothetical protein